MSDRPQPDSAPCRYCRSRAVVVFTAWKDRMVEAEAGGCEQHEDKARHWVARCGQVTERWLSVPVEKEEGVLF